MPLRSISGNCSEARAACRRALEAEALAEVRPNLGRPLVDRIKGSAIHNLKELHPGSACATEVRILFVFDPWRSAILLVAGDKAGDWSGWYRHTIPHADNSMRPT